MDLATMLKCLLPAAVVGTKNITVMSDSTQTKACIHVGVFLLSKWKT